MNLNSSTSKTSTYNVANLLQIEEIYAGVERDREGIPVPSAFGRLCRWWGTRPAATYASYADFQKGLNLDCQDFENEGNEEKSAFTPKSMMSEHHVNKKDNRKRRPPGILQFTPTEEMPDIQYPIMDKFQEDEIAFQLLSKFWVFCILIIACIF